MGQHDNKIEITVEYTGKDPYMEGVHGNPTFEHIKLQAMKAFGLEASAASRYVLQLDGADLSDRAHVGSLGRTSMTLELVLNQEPEKG